MKPLYLCAMIICFCALLACALGPDVDANLPLSNSEYLPQADVSVEIASLSSCTHVDNATLHLNTKQPLTVIVHGCFSSAGQFRSLADVFAFHGQQTICFNYDDRDSLSQSSAELVTAIEELSKVLESPDITIIGHSQGGLVARRAFIEERPDRFQAEDTRISLATISAPFGGIGAASHCGSKVLTWLSLGLVKPICQLITGAKYKDIPPNSDFINDPGRLAPVVARHLKIATDESDSCRRYNDRGRCVEDDYVFSLEEQSQAAIADDPGLAEVTVKAGHVEIVGDVDTTPTKLIAILQQQNILNATPAGRGNELARLLADLYLSP